jgi:outer membrane murein-binding lipoprotein Lpp
VRRLIPVAIVVTVAVLAGCSHDNKPTAAQSSTSTAAAFTAKVNALCATEGQAIGGVIGQMHSKGEPTEQDMQAALDQIVSLSRGLASDIQALPVPPALSGNVAAYVSALNAGTATAAAQKGPAFFASNDDPWSKATALAKEDGLTSCVPSDS